MPPTANRPIPRSNTSRMPQDDALPASPIINPHHFFVCFSKVHFFCLSYSTSKFSRTWYQVLSLLFVTVVANCNMRRERSNTERETSTTYTSCRTNDNLEALRPFEWLTSASSLKSILSKSNIFKNNNHNDCNDDYNNIEGTCSSHGQKATLSRKALHVGCGSSTLGEYLVQELDYQEVVNVDIDKEVLDQMKTRWDNNTSVVSSSDENDSCSSQKQRNNNETIIMDFVQVDLSSERVPYPSGYFDLVVDKSTLDCTLCSDEASAGLLCEAYRSLKDAKDNEEGDGGGVYVIISFHHKDLLLPMLQNLPGAEWTVEHQVIARQVEDLISNPTSGSTTAFSNASTINDTVELPECSAEASLPRTTASTSSSAWSNSGEFEPNEQYRRFVNVFICQKTNASKKAKTAPLVELDREAVRGHIHQTNDDWFQSQNPMLTKSRIEDLRMDFGKLLQDSPSNYLDLQSCFGILFTDAEREHLTFDYFLEDWRAFLEEFPNIAKHEMTFETACKFLQVMQ